nr:thyrotropin-releasing hormone receptor-like [Parasteatoda tepidariorum]
MQVLGDEWIWGRWGCAIFIFLQYLGINASSLSITAFTIERYIAICHPMKAQFICTVNRAKKIIIGVWIFASIYCSPWLFLTKTAPIYYKGYEDLETCTFALSRNLYVGYFMADMVLFYAFPLLLSVILYSLIAKILFTNEIPKTPGKKNGSTPLSTGDSKKSNNNYNARVQRNKDRSKLQGYGKNKKYSDFDESDLVVKMLIVVVVLFATLWFPYRFLVVYNSFASNRYMELWFLMFCKTMIFINSAINPILYNAMSIKFRKAFKRLLSCGQKARPNIPTRYTTVTTAMGDDAV